ncbi:MAG TPA: hypothetical protein VFS39_10450 [Nitrospira sp.]|nr:hypothetical protein [Nitrospira sp.]
MRSLQTGAAVVGCCLCMLSVGAAATDRTAAYGTIPVDPKYQANLGAEGQRVHGGCVESLRRASAESHVDAYVDEGAVKFSGTDQERFQLEKCMAQYGVPIVSMQRPGLPQ